MRDYHVHTRYCRHAVGEVYDYVDKAVCKGVREIGFADHYPMYYLPYIPFDDYSMNPDELSEYLEEIKKASKFFQGKIEVKTGIEVDYYKGCDSLLKRNLKSIEFDYIIGVIHLLDDWVIDDPREAPRYKEADLGNLYSQYFREVKSLIRSGLFDIVGHLDVIKRFNFIPEGGVEQYIIPLLDVIVERNICVEINTSGIDRPVKDTYPGFNLFKTMYDRGVIITLGSDAHKPEEVARYFESVSTSLKKVGYDQVACFHKRERVFKQI